MRRLLLFALAVMSVATASGDSQGAAPKAPQKKPVLLRLVGADSLTSEILLAGTPDQPVYFFRDPTGLRLRFERTGDRIHGFTRRYSFVGAQGGYVEILDLFIFHTQGLPYQPMVITINGDTIAGYLDDGTETKRLGKKVYEQFQKLPSSFRKALYNFCIFGSNVKWIDVDAGEAGVLLSENWLAPGLPDYQVTVVRVGDDDDAVANFQRQFTE